MTTHIPEFGLDPAADYILRLGGYAIIFNAAAEVAVVRTPGGLFLPGGGQEGAESPEEAAIRETGEECGLQIVLGACVGVADELIFAPGSKKRYRKRGAFFLAECVGSVEASEPDHELVWLSLERALAELREGSQRWAVARAYGRRSNT